METAVRKKLSAIRAALRHLFDRGGGFFVQYDYVDSIRPVERPYEAVEQLCEAAPFREFLAEMNRDIPNYQQLGSSADDPDWNGRMFPPLDCAALYTAVRKFQPKRIVEIGSGDTTRFMARAAAPSTRITCIDPAPRRSIEHLPVEFVRRVLTDDDVETCAQLEANDILFIDSSHIMLPGMDVDIEFNRIFPRLQPGVIVHVHDIFLPFDYPSDWRDRHWSEQNALVGWLFGAFEIVFPGHYVVRRHPELIDEAVGAFPQAAVKDAGSMWLRKRAVR
ncbi:class I SAM-dependent methyltransferase [Sphingomonas sp.]|jgi:predicted O-methyltransferase YrrM|uniref:class I SAM-dependent methyltransferase n=1 Tax=Sphingomonas sp. TaxID=28214 RepID=UPI002DE5878E|nr:class I SAM-dependent methyltransferase [Sphingomonas sp.]